MFFACLRLSVGKFARQLLSKGCQWLLISDERRQWVPGTGSRNWKRTISQHKERVSRVQSSWKTGNPSLEVAPSTTCIAQRTWQKTANVSDRNVRPLNTSHRNVHPWPKRKFSSCDRQLWHVALTFKLDLGRIKMSQRARYPDQRPFISKVVVRAHRYIQFTRWTELICRQNFFRARRGLDRISWLLSAVVCFLARRHS